MPWWRFGKGAKQREATMAAQAESEEVVEEVADEDIIEIVLIPPTPPCARIRQV